MPKSARSLALRSTARLLIVAVATLMLAARIHTASTPVAAASPLFPTVDDAAQPLPPGLSLPGNDPSIHDAIRIVASDIDDDGDLDVVANNGSLELTVWENDGDGHFTRKRPQHDGGWQPEPPGPSWDSSGAAGLSSLQSDPPTVGVDSTPSVPFPLEYALSETRCPLHATAAGHSVSSRAPPRLL